MNFFIGLGLKNRDITVFGDGHQQRNISFIGDTVEGLILSAVSPNTDGEVYFGASDYQYSVRQIAEGIAEVIGGRVRFVDWPKDREVIEIGDAVIENKKLRAAIQWNPSTDLHAGLAKTRDYFAPVLDHYL